MSENSDVDREPSVDWRRLCPMTCDGRTLARFARPRAECPTRIAILSDLHLSTREAGTWKAYDRTEPRLDRAVAALNDRPLDGAVFAGDLTKDGEPWNHDRVAASLDDLTHPLVVVPGNHDLHATFDGHEGIGPAAFAARYGADGYPLRRRFGDLDVLALNSNAATDDSPTDSFEGHLAGDSLAWLAETLPAVETPLVVVHHNLPGTRRTYERLRERLPDHGDIPGFADAEGLLDVLADGDAPLVLTGHVHTPLVARERGVTELSVPALGSFPCAYTVLEIDERGTRVTMHPVADDEELAGVVGDGRERDRVLLSTVQLARFPLVDDPGYGVNV